MNVFKYMTELPVELYCERMDAFRTYPVNSHLGVQTECRQVPCFCQQPALGPVAARGPPSPAVEGKEESVSRAKWTTSCYLEP